LPDLACAANTRGRLSSPITTVDPPPHLPVLDHVDGGLTLLVGGIEVLRQFLQLRGTFLPRVAHRAHSSKHTLTFKSATRAFTAASFVFATARRSFASRKACHEHLRRSAVVITRAQTQHLALGLHSDNNVSVCNNVDNPRAKARCRRVLCCNNLHAINCKRKTSRQRHTAPNVHQS
jgi:hypothetical protein